MSRRLVGVAAVAATLVVLVAVLPAAAHVTSDGNLVTSEDHLDPGTSFSVFGSQLDAGATVTFWLLTPTKVWPLGEAQIAQDGTLSADFDVPTDIPLGDAWLYGKTSAGTSLELYVHVGPRAVSPEAAGSTTAIPTLDERVIGFGLLAAGLVVFVAAGGRYLRGRSTGASHAD